MIKIGVYQRTKIKNKHKRLDKEHGTNNLKPKGRSLSKSIKQRLKYKDRNLSKNKS
ncbi:MAG: hypothetical protein R3Y64_09260 [Peptostreptococcaceae bacterium]